MGKVHKGRSYKQSEEETMAEPRRRQGDTRSFRLWVLPACSFLSSAVGVLQRRSRELLGQSLGPTSFLLKLKAK